VWLTSGQIVEGPPLDNGETTEYKRFVKEVVTDGQTGPRATALALVSCRLSYSSCKPAVSVGIRRRARSATVSSLAQISY
jgi:hypothetical protein